MLPVIDIPRVNSAAAMHEMYDQKEILQNSNTRLVHDREREELIPHNIIIIHVPV